MTLSVKRAGIVRGFMASLRGKLTALRSQRSSGAKPFKMPVMLTASNILQMSETLNCGAVKYVLHKPTKRMAVGPHLGDHCTIGKEVIRHKDMGVGDSKHVIGGYIEITKFRQEGDNRDWVGFEINAMSGFYGTKNNEIDIVAEFLREMLQAAGFVPGIVKTGNYPNSNRFVFLAAKPGGKSNHA